MSREQSTQICWRPSYERASVATDDANLGGLGVPIMGVCMGARACELAASWPFRSCLELILPDHAGMLCVR